MADTTKLPPFPFNLPRIRTRPRARLFKGRTVARLNSRMIAMSIDVVLLLLIGMVLYPLQTGVEALVLPGLDLQQMQADSAMAITQWAENQLAGNELLAHLWQNQALQYSVYVNALQLLFAAALIIPFWHRYRATPCMMALGLYLSREDGQNRFGWGVLVARFFATAAAIAPLGLGMLTIPFNARGKALPDFATRQLVLQGPNLYTRWRQNLRWGDAVAESDAALQAWPADQPPSDKGE